MYDLMMHFSKSDEAFESGLSLFDLPDHNRDTASATSNLDSEKAAGKSYSITATDEPAASLPDAHSVGADVSKVAQAIVSLADPRSAWVTGEKIIVTGG
jgi:NAD(P)-dependent dehydrogenase (short-subunit alcohol dehydrogenase family)